MYEQISFTDVLKGVLELLRSKVGDIPVLDIVPKNQTLPFINVDFLGVEEIPSKTMKKDKFEIYIHGWAEGEESSQPIYDLIDSIREAMTVAVELPEGYELLIQKPTGIQRILQNEDDSRHAVLGYSLVITSGYKMKI